MCQNYQMSVSGKNIRIFNKVAIVILEIKKDQFWCGKAFGRSRSINEQAKSYARAQREASMLLYFKYKLVNIQSKTSIEYILL